MPSRRDTRCTFCAVIAGELPATLVHETDDLLAFLDHRPVFRGHVLLVPKQHVQVLSDLSAELVPPFFTLSQRLQRAVEDGLGADGSLILINNIISQSVPHLHLHVIPRHHKDGLRFWLGPRHPYEDGDPASAYAKRIRAALLSPADMNPGMGNSDTAQGAIALIEPSDGQRPR